MTIVCGTDFSESSARAARAAAAIAQRLGATLKLVHVLDDFGAELSPLTFTESMIEPARERLRRCAAELAARYGARVEPAVVPGVPHEILVEAARVTAAQVLVVASLGDKKPRRWLLGSVAERVAQVSPVPVLVVRHGESIEAWTAGLRTLRVLVGVERSASAETALRWASELRKLGTCDLAITQIAYPIAEHTRRGLAEPAMHGALSPELHDRLLEELRSWVGALPGKGETQLAIKPGSGHVDEHLTLAADDANADLLVVGTPQRAASARLWKSSVSRGVLHHATGNVVCVPSSSSEREAPIPSFRRVLVPTDFSAHGNRAVAVGYGLVDLGGVVHLLHVIPQASAELVPNPRERLRSLVPKAASLRKVRTEIELCDDDTVAEGIARTATKLGVDAICMATFGGSTRRAGPLGSQAQEVLRRAGIPVLFVGPEGEP